MSNEWEWNIFKIKGIDASSIAALSCCCGNGVMKPNIHVSTSREKDDLVDSKCGVGIYFCSDESGALVISSLDSEGVQSKRKKILAVQRFFPFDGKRAK